MKERYEEIKHLFPNYLIAIKNKKNKYMYIDIDRKIVNLFGDEGKVNKIKLNNLEIEYKKENEDNRYDEYYIKTKLILFLKEYGGKYYAREKDEGNTNFSNINNNDTYFYNNEY